MNKNPFDSGLVEYEIFQNHSNETDNKHWKYGIAIWKESRCPVRKIWMSLICKWEIKP